MAWTRGTSGNPAGRPPSEKAFANLLRIALKEPGKGGVPKLRQIVDKLVKHAIDGEAWAIQQVADRLDGKPAQESMLAVEKHCAADWTREELVAFLEAEGGRGTSQANGSSPLALPAPPTLQRRASLEDMRAHREKS